jgi:hypothetical protein
MVYRCTMMLQGGSQRGIVEWTRRQTVLIVQSKSSTRLGLTVFTAPCADSAPTRGLSKIREAPREGWANNISQHTGGENAWYRSILFLKNEYQEEGSQPATWDSRRAYRPSHREEL